MNSGELLSLLDSVNCDTESRSERGVQHYVIKFANAAARLATGLWFSPRVIWFPPPIKLTATIQLKYC